MDAIITDDQRRGLLDHVEALGKEVKEKYPESADLQQVRKLYRYVKHRAETVRQVVQALRYVSNTGNILVFDRVRDLSSVLLAPCVHGTSGVRHCQKCEDSRTNP